MRLTELLAENNINWVDVDITGVTADSRMVKPGYLFAALRGSTADGTQFIPDAVARGAAAVLAGPETKTGGLKIPFVLDDRPRRRLSQIAARFHRRQPNTIVAVTGTAGKTSVTVFLRQIWEHMGFAAASLGTIGICGGGLDDATPLTTPDPVKLHQTLAQLVVKGVQFLAMEASSHGLDQARLDGVQIAAAVFTNLGHDHLDYHLDMEKYFAAKARLFSELLPSGGVAILNADEPRYRELREICQQRNLAVLSFGTAVEADVRFEIQTRERQGRALHLTVCGQVLDVWLPLVADFQVENACAALAAAIAVGADPLKAAVVLNDLLGAPGRMQWVASAPNGGQVFVDYAHKPQGLEKALQALRPDTPGKLLVVFGCGGDRDRDKRPVMGEIAMRLADRVIVTDDNPRSEDADTIRAEILAAAPGAQEIGERALAIKTACGELGPQDTLLVAGKGHETGQYIGDRIIPFDDSVEVRKAISNLGRAPS